AYVAGVTWQDTGTVDVDARYLIDGVWDTWRELAADDAAGQRPGSEDLRGTEPFIITDASAFQVRVSTTGAVPSTLTVSLFSAEVETFDVDLNLSGGGVGTLSTTRGAALRRAMTMAPVPRVNYGALPVPGARLAGLVDNPQPTIHLRDE